MNSNCDAAYRSFAAACGTKARALYLALGVLGTAVAANTEEPCIVTFDAPGAGTGAFQGTGCFAFSDCSVLINDEGDITGYYLDTNNVFHGFLRQCLTPP